MSTHRIRPTFLVAALTVLMTALALAVPPSAAAQEADVDPARLDGANRFATAANTATLTFESAEVAIIATGEDYPDALAASFAAGRASAPILLVAHDNVPTETRAALDSLDVGEVVLLGGANAISEGVEQQLAAEGYTTQRQSGADRFATAAAVATTFGAQEVGTFEGQRTAILASGEGFADALAAGPIAAHMQFPLLLTPRDAIVDSTNEALAELDIERIIIVGGQAAVSAAVANAYDDAGYTMERWSGADRTETAVVVAQNAIERIAGFDPSGILLARGDDFPDALAASIHGASIGGPILLTANPTVLSPATEGYLFDLCPRVEFVRALGGTSAVSEQALSEAVSAAGQCEHGEGDPSQSYIISPQESIEADPGAEQEFFLIGQGEDVEGAGELALFPCDNVVFDEGDVYFTDANNDGFADGAGTSNTGDAWISQINDVEQSRDQVRDRGFDPEGYSFHLRAEVPDCTVPVIWHVSAGQELPVDADGAPRVPFGAGLINWSDD